MPFEQEPGVDVRAKTGRGVMQVTRVLLGQEVSLLQETHAG